MRYSQTFIGGPIQTIPKGLAQTIHRGIDTMNSCIVKKSKQGGKLTILKAYRKNDKIIYTLQGDFFLHPETAIGTIEKILTESEYHSVEEILKVYIKDHHIQLIGVDVPTIINLLQEVRTEL
ncbi:hypothetical protein COV16_02035 [Candidatus Woesearchaeota archaeon CG10_big_fil_rev_8_21_14_0_10_34_8]|nr:MAG: hypothetical protein COV16_02035 [Candidatus Woesearchaeota archaeon CG10_big_fil_rev_8_21_14_0_10_34_8]